MIIIIYSHALVKNDTTPSLLEVSRSHYTFIKDYGKTIMLQFKSYNTTNSFQYVNAHKQTRWKGLGLITHLTCVFTLVVREG